MADWDTKYVHDNNCNHHQNNNNSSSNSNHSRQSSGSSRLSGSNKENQSMDPHEAASDVNTDSSSERELILRDGTQLAEESRTEYVNQLTLQTFGIGSAPDIPSRTTMSNQGSGPGTAKARAAKSPYTSGPIEAISEEEISIPNDANLSNFSVDQLANFFMCLKVDDRIISHLHRKSVDGKRFSKLKDSELETLGMKNPVVIYFRDKSTVKTKKKGPFML